MPSKQGKERTHLLIRLPEAIYEKLCRLKAAQVARGTPAASMNSVIIELIDRATERGRTAR